MCVCVVHAPSRFGGILTLSVYLCCGRIVRGGRAGSLGKERPRPHWAHGKNAPEGRELSPAVFAVKIGHELQNAAFGSHLVPEVAHWGAELTLSASCRVCEKNEGGFCSSAATELCLVVLAWFTILILILVLPFEQGIIKACENCAK